MKKWKLLLVLILFCVSIAAAEEADIQQGRKEDTAVESMQSQTCADLAVTGNTLWQIVNGEILCTDVHSRQITARLSIHSLFENQEDYLSLSAWEDRVWLCTAWNAGTAACKVALFELQTGNTGITLLRSLDVSASLKFLFDGQIIWREVEMKACAGGMYVAGMDEDQIFRMYLYDPETEQLTMLGSQPFDNYSGIFPCKEGLLLCGTDEIMKEKENVFRISLPSGERTAVGSFLTDITFFPSCLAFDEKEQTLYFVMNGTGYSVSVGQDSQTKPFCTVSADTAPLRYGAIAEEIYIVLNEQGTPVFMDSALSDQIRPFRILDLTGAETLTEISGIFSAENPDDLPVIVYGDEEETVLNTVLSQSADYDAFAVRLGSNLYKTLRARGYLAAMNGSDILSAAVETMPERIRTAVRDADQLLAFPVSVTNTSLALNVPAVINMLGITREEIPSDWPGFLGLLSELAEKKLLKDENCSLYDEGLSANTLKSIFFSWTMEDLMLWMSRDETRINDLQRVYLPVLQAFEQVPWEFFGQEEDSGWAETEDAVSLVLMTEPEIAVMALDPGVEYWPLSLGKDGERLTGQEVGVIVLNPYSARKDAVIRYTETIWNHLDIVQKMELDQDLNEPVVNQDFDEDMVFWDRMMDMYREAIEAAGDLQEAAGLQAELSELSAFVENYRQNAQWIVSEESIALYRTLEPMLALKADEFWSEAAEDQSVFQFLDGMMPASLFVEQLASAMKMSVLEEN